MIIECPQCHIHYEVGDTLPAEGMNVRCAECSHVWLAAPPVDGPETPALQSNENPPDSSLDKITQPDSPGSPEIITTENDQAKAEKNDFPAMSSNEFDSEEIIEENKDIHSDRLFDEVHDEIYIDNKDDTPTNTEPLEPATEKKPASANGTDASGLTTSNGHSIGPERSDPTSVGNQINEAIGGIASGAAKTPQPKGSRSRIALYSWIAVLAAIAGLAIIAFSMPNKVARTLPVTVGLYDAFGIATNSRGLVIRDVKYEHASDDGRPTLILNGRVHNVTEETLKVPTVIVELRDRDGLVLFLWATRAEQDKLAPGKTAPFNANIPAPTDLVRQVKLRFSTRP